jgi:hypothetical protein
VSLEDVEQSVPSSSGCRHALDVICHRRQTIVAAEREEFRGGGVVKIMSQRQLQSTLLIAYTLYNDISYV